MDMNKKDNYEILKSLILYRLVASTNDEFKGEKFEKSKPKGVPSPTEKSYMERLDVSRDVYNLVREDIEEMLLDFQEYTFWETFCSRVADVFRLNEEEKHKEPLNEKDTFIYQAKYMSDINNRLAKCDLVSLWKHISTFFV